MDWKSGAKFMGVACEEQTTTYPDGTITTTKKPNNEALRMLCCTACVLAAVGAVGAVVVTRGEVLELVA